MKAGKRKGPSADADGMVYRGSKVRQMLAEKDRIIANQSALSMDLVRRNEVLVNVARNALGIVKGLSTDLETFLTARYPQAQLKIEGANQVEDVAKTIAGHADAIERETHQAMDLNDAQQAAQAQLVAIAKQTIDDLGLVVSQDAQLQVVGDTIQIVGDPDQTVLGYRCPLPHEIESSGGLLGPVICKACSIRADWSAGWLTPETYMGIGESEARAQDRLEGLPTPGVNAEIFAGDVLADIPTLRRGDRPDFHLADLQHNLIATRAATELGMDEPETVQALEIGDRLMMGAILVGVRCELSMHLQPGAGALVCPRCGLLTAQAPGWLYIDPVDEVGAVKIGEYDGERFVVSEEFAGTPARDAEHVESEARSTTEKTITLDVDQLRQDTPEMRVTELEFPGVGRGEEPTRVAALLCPTWSEHAPSASGVKCRACGGPYNEAPRFVIPGAS